MPRMEGHVPAHRHRLSCRCGVCAGLLTLVTKTLQQDCLGASMFTMPRMEGHVPAHRHRLRCRCDMYAELQTAKNKTLQRYCSGTPALTKPRMKGHVPAHRHEHQQQWHQYEARNNFLQVPTRQLNLADQHCLCMLHLLTTCKGTTFGQHKSQAVSSMAGDTVEPVRRAFGWQSVTDVNIEVS